MESVTTVEHDEKWYRYLSKRVPPNVNIVYQTLVYGGEYCKAALRTHERYHIIVIDGRDRNNCAKHTLDALCEEGIVILDDSNREEYKEGISFLCTHQFREIAFWGIGPGHFMKKCTSIFYRESNCFGI